MPLHHKLLSNNAILGSWVIVISRALDSTYTARNLVYLKFSVNMIIITIINSTPCNHFQEYDTCVLSCYLQAPFTWLQESKRAGRTTTKTSLRTSRWRWVWHALQRKDETQNPPSNEHSTQCRFIFHHWMVPNLHVCVCMREYLHLHLINSDIGRWLSICMCCTLATPGWISACLHYQ